MLTYQDLANEACAKFAVVDNNRMARAILIAANKTSIYNQRCPRGQFDVRSDHPSVNGGWYRVDLAKHYCSCKDSRKGNVCKHRLAVWLRQEILCRVYAQVRGVDKAIIAKELGYTA